ncbi:unnamed protein product [Paramecium sonneborni]|uniref:Replication factor C C-terminal domain-containing protein n=1 Tax=Paramecium sonneborni TaxID=65129 RepID=A0A8S1Q8N8_9CILI|nr:unnamed protein product [Paramecium sonneborni]
MSRKISSQQNRRSCILGRSSFKVYKEFSELEICLIFYYMDLQEQERHLQLQHQQNNYQDQNFGDQGNKCSQKQSQKICRINSCQKSKLQFYKIIILDEADSMTNDTQSALRRIIEDYASTTRFCIIYITKIIEPLVSRCVKYRFKPIPENEQIERLKYVADKDDINKQMILYLSFKLTVLDLFKKNVLELFNKVQY